MKGITSVIYTCCIFVPMFLNNNVQCSSTSDCVNASSSSIRCRPNPCQDGVNGVLHMKVGEHIRCESSHSGEGTWQCPSYRISGNDLTIPSDFPLNTRISCIYSTEFNEESRNITMLLYEHSRSVNTKAPGEVSGASLDEGKIAGIVIGSIVGFAVLLALIIFILCCKKWYQKMWKKLRCKNKKDKDKSGKYETDKTSTHSIELIEIGNKDSATQTLKDASAQTAQAALIAEEVDESTTSQNGSSVDDAEELPNENDPMMDKNNTSSDSTKASEQPTPSTSQSGIDKVWNPSQHSVVPVTQPVATDVEAAIRTDNDITAIKPDTTLIHSGAKSGESHHEEDV